MILPGGHFKVLLGTIFHNSIYNQAYSGSNPVRLQFIGANPTSHVHAVLGALMFTEVLCSRLRGTLMQ
jgi:hypothetical protein